MVHRRQTYALGQVCEKRDRGADLPVKHRGQQGRDCARFSSPFVLAPPSISRLSMRRDLQVSDKTDLSDVKKKKKKKDRCNWVTWELQINMLDLVGEHSA